MRTSVQLAVVACLSSLAVGAAAADLQKVLFVGNNWDGTATVLTGK
jgi:hypothetical protein